MRKIKLICADCDSENIVADANCIWCCVEQDWVANAIFDDRYCNDCGCDQVLEEEIA